MRDYPAPILTTQHLILRRYGDNGYLIDVSSRALITSLFHFLGLQQTQEHHSSLSEIIPAEHSILVIGSLSPQEFVEILHSWDPSTQRTEPPRIIDIPTLYDGPDLEDVAGQWNLSVRSVIDLHVSTTFTCSFCGFLPGFAYLTGLPQQYLIRRRSTPRTTLPAGSVGLAGGYCGIYPRDSPGGWQIIGHTTFEPWIIDRDPPGQIIPGDQVRFSEVQ